MDLGEIQEPTDTRAEELTADDLTEMSASCPAPDSKEEAVLESQITSDSLAEGLWLSKTASGSFYDVDPSKMQAVRLKQMVEEGLVPCRNIFREMKKQKKPERNGSACL